MMKPKTSGWIFKENLELRESDRFPVSSLSDLTGFPIDFIKKELLIENDTLSLSELRVSMVNYLNTNLKESPLP